MIQQIYFCVYLQRVESKAVKGYPYTHIHDSIILNSQKSEAAQGLWMDGWMEKCGISIQWNSIQS